MPPVIAAILTFAFPGLVGVTVGGVALSTLLANVLFTGILMLASYLLTPKPSIPKPDESVQSRRSTTPRRGVIVGYAREGGDSMLWEAHKGWSVNVLAIHHGEITDIVGWYLNDRAVTLIDGTWVHQDGGTEAVTGEIVQPLPDGSFGNLDPPKVRILWRPGRATETHYAAVARNLPSGVWPTNARGDGIASVAFLCRPTQAKYVMTVYQGRDPELSAVVKGAKFFDWRDPGQDVDDPSTWQWTDNRMVALANYLFREDIGGLGLPYERVIARCLGAWTAAADVDDEAVALKGGGTEKRWRIWGKWYLESEPGEIIGQMLASGDGWLVPGGSGGLIPKSGRYVEPTVTLTGDDILDYTINRGVEAENAVGKLIISYTSADHDYSTQEAEAWTVAGAEGRDLSVSAPWVPSHAQARRVAKREFARLSSRISGTFVMPLIGNKVLGGVDPVTGEDDAPRYVRVQIPAESAVLADAVVEIRDPVDIDLMAGVVTAAWVLADPTVDAWNPASEEGTAPPVLTRVDDDEIPVPTGLVPSTEIVKTDGGVVVGLLSVTATDDAGLSLVVDYRLTDVGGGTPGQWLAEPLVFDDPTIAAGVASVTIGLLAANTVYDIRAAWQTSKGKRGSWSTPPVQLSTATDLVAPARPVIDAVTIVTGAPSIAVTAPSSANVKALRVFRALSGGSFSSATDISGAVPASRNVSVTVVDSAAGPGAYDYFATAENASGVSSLPAGPQAATVTNHVLGVGAGNVLGVGSGDVLGI